MMKLKVKTPNNAAVAASKALVNSGIRVISSFGDGNGNTFMEAEISEQTLFCMFEQKFQEEFKKITNGVITPPCVNLNK